MAKFCGGIKLGDSFKVINGIICDANADSVDASNGDYRVWSALGWCYICS